MRYDGEPVAESGDGTVLLDVPGDWERLDTSGCEFARPRFGPTDVDPCEGEAGVSLYGSATFDPLHGPGLSHEDEGETENGTRPATSTPASTPSTSPGSATRSRVECSARPGRTAWTFPTSSAAWSRQEAQGVAVDVPADGVEVSVSSVPVRADFPVGVTLAEQRDTRWIGGLQIDGSHLVEVDAPTQALAELVASSSRLQSGFQERSVPSDPRPAGAPVICQGPVARARSERSRLCAGTWLGHRSERQPWQHPRPDVPRHRSQADDATSTARPEQRRRSSR